MVLFARVFEVGVCMFVCLCVNMPSCHLLFATVTRKPKSKRVSRPLELKMKRIGLNGPGADLSFLALLFKHSPEH